MFFKQDNDEDDFMPSKSSNLASLFGTAPTDHSSKPLTYTAPKQPRKNKSTVGADGAGDVSKDTSKAGQLAVIQAAVVHVYKFEGTQPVHQGKLGIALLGNYESNQYLLTLYKDKHQRLANATINLNFSYTVQSNKYASFYDDSRQSWSVNFDSDQLAIEFAKQLALMKANSCGASGMTAVLIQELTPGVGQTIEQGDSVDLKFTGWICEKHKFGSIFDSNASSDKYLKVAVGDGKIIKGMEIGITGLKLGGKRLLIIPPTLGYGARGMEPKVPSNAVLIFQVEARHESSESRSASPHRAERGEKPNLPAKPISISSTEDPTVKALGASISEQLQSSPKNSKAKIISRMAKMGQPLLPLQGAIPVQPASSESETEDELRQASSAQHHQSSPSPEPSPKPLPRASHHTSLSSSSSSSRSPQHATASAVTAPSNHQAPGGFVSNGPYPVFNQQQPSFPLAGHQQSLVAVTPTGGSYMMMPGQPFMGTQTDTHTPVLLAEVRAQNTELRLQVGQLSEKMERLLGKVDHSAAYPSMDAAILGHNIQRVIRENETLKLEVKEKNEKIDSQMEKITQLLQRNQKFLEQSNTMLEQRSDFLQSSSAHTQERMSSLEHEKTQLQTQLGVAQRRLLEVEARLTSAVTAAAAATASASVVDEEAAAQTRNRFDALQSENNRLSSENEVIRSSVCQHQREIAESGEELSLQRRAMEDLRRSLLALEQERDGLRSTLDARAEEALQSGSRDEVTQWKNKYDDLLTKLEWLQCQLKEQTAALARGTAAAPKINMLDEIKKIMNAVYKNLHQQFEVGTEYSGDQIKGVLAATIRSVTLELVDYFSQADSVETPPVTEVASTEPKVDVKSPAVIDSVEKLNDDNEVEAAEASVTDVQSDVTSHVKVEKEKEEVSTLSQDAAEVKDTQKSSVAVNVKTPTNASSSNSWKPQPPPLFDEIESDTDDDWLK